MRIGGIVENVPFQDTVFVFGAEIFQLLEHVLQIGDAEFDLDFAVGCAMVRHASEYSLALLAGHHGLASLPANEVARAGATPHNPRPTVLSTPNRCVPHRKINE